MTSFLPSGDVATPRVLPIRGAPANLPVVVRLNLLRYMAAARRIELIAVILFGPTLLAIGIALAVVQDPTLEAGDRRSGWILVAAALFIAAYLPISAWRQWKGGFSLGADQTGVYLRPNLDRNRVVFVPWGGVEAVCVRRWRGPQLVVKPRDTLIESQFKLETKGRWEDWLIAEIAQHRRTKRLGTNIHAPIPGVDATELLNSLRYQAAGRAPVELR